MILSIIILTLSLAAFLFFRSAISKDHNAQRQDLKRRHAELQAQFDHLCAQKKSLAVEAATLDRQISKMKCTDAPERPLVTTQPPPKKAKLTGNERVASYLLTNGLISLEQHQRAAATMRTLKLDLIGTCLTLGFIDESTALEVNDHLRKGS
ncbi:MAG: hypothetical protein AB7E32_15510 [Desulfovibrio sp.]